MDRCAAPRRAVAGQNSLINGHTPVSLEEDESVHKRREQYMEKMEAQLEKIDIGMVYNYDVRESARKKAPGNKEWPKDTAANEFKIVRGGPLYQHAAAACPRASLRCAAPPALAFGFGGFGVRACVLACAPAAHGGAGRVADGRRGIPARLSAWAPPSPPLVLAASASASRGC